MDDSKNINRRQALKTMGIAALSAGLGIMDASSANLFTGNKDKMKKLKVLLVNGSPNKEGCTFTALSEMAKVLNQNDIETEIYWIGRDPISGCLGCGACSHSGRCVIQDDVNAFLDKANEFDGFVFGSPVHFSAVAGNMTSFMNRVFFAARASKVFWGKVGAAVTSTRRAGATATLDQLNRYFIHGGMPVVPSQYWPMVFGNSPEQVQQDAEGLQIMRTQAQNMTWMMRCISLGQQNGVGYPEREPRVATNFIR